MAPEGFTLVAAHSNGLERIYRRERDGVLLKRTEFEDGKAITQRVGPQFLVHARGLVQWHFEPEATP